MPPEAELIQAKLDAFLRIAKNNEQKQFNFQQYELNLLNCTGLFDLLSLILEQHRDQFQLSEVTLLLYDHQYEFQRLLDLHPKPASWRNRLFFTDKERALTHTFNILPKPRLATYSANLHQLLFPDHAELKSVAILPLKRRNKLIGSLNLGSRKSDRFQPNIGTLFLEHLTAVISACIENARLQERIKQLGLLDPLTGLNNRRFFDQRIAEEVTLARRNNSPLSCLFIDLDHFKQVNDTHGHHAGDLALKQASHIFSDSMRTSDVLARYGGEEFVIILADTDSDTAYDIAERIRITIANTDFDINASEPLTLTLSIGLATMNENTRITTTSQLLESADQAVYAAKTLGRNRVHRSH
ncbi:MAG: diguanylate cyclase [Methylophaga sp.]|nr:MAG: diguanylate cyclase [Methylophaga sp.]